MLEPGLEYRMITGRQIRAARALLGMQMTTLARLASVPLTALIRAEQAEDEPMITVAQASAIEAVLTAAGIEFAEDGAPRGMFATQGAPQS
jgi:DNA-binding XRE family transcriptional regulator